MAQAKLKVILLRATPDPDELVALGARLCYARADLDALQQKVESGDQRGFVERVMQRGHLSVTEHASFTFAVEGVSRALLAQLTRHRIASFSVQSQRYVSMADGFDYVIPPAIEALGEDERQEFIRQMETMHTWYCRWQEKLGGAKESANEDARFVLPNAAATRLVMTMNARELMPVTPSENRMSVSFLQAWKACCSILVTLLPIVTSVSALQPSKVQEAIPVTPSGMVISVRLWQL